MLVNGYVISARNIVGSIPTHGPIIIYSIIERQSFFLYP